MSSKDNAGSSYLSQTNKAKMTGYVIIFSTVMVNIVELLRSSNRKGVPFILNCACRLHGLSMFKSLKLLDNFSSVMFCNSILTKTLCIKQVNLSTSGVLSLKRNLQHKIQIITLVYHRESVIRISIGK
jgi:hypothetical protein